MTGHAASSSRIPQTWTSAAPRPIATVAAAATQAALRLDSPSRGFSR